MRVFKMGSSGARLLLVLLVVCFIVSVCDARGGGRGGRGRSRSRYSSGGGGSSAGGGKSVGTMLLIIFGVIGGTLLFIGLVYFCIHVCTPESTEEEANSNRDVLLSSPAPAESSNTADGAVHTSSHSVYDNRNESSIPPPSYDSVVNQKDGAVLYPAQSDKGHSYSYV